MNSAPVKPDCVKIPLNLYLSAVLSGVMLALSFPKPGLSIFAWVAFIPLLRSVSDLEPRQAVKLGFVAGFTAYAGIVYWLVIVMNSYGKLPLFISIPLMLVMAGYLALYLAGTVAVVKAGQLVGVSSVISFPLAWTGFEYLRSFALTGFPWASLGYSQYKILPIIQIADSTGVYGVSFLIAIVNVALLRAFLIFFCHAPVKRGLWAISIAMLLIIATVSYGFIRLTTPETGTPLKVALIQGNISQDLKWDPSFQEKTVAIYERLTNSVAAYKPDLIVWPESATPFFFQNEPTYDRRVRNLAVNLNAPLIFGSPAYEKQNDRTHFLNSAFLVMPSGEVAGRSDKIHLVPFGEYVPMKNLLPFVNKLVEGIGDFSPGKSATPLDTGSAKAGVLVCFEGIFPELSRAYVNAGAGILVNISNDAWYKRSSAPYQHLSMTVFRAVENRVPLVRATNTGITAIIDSKGHFIGMTQIFREATLTGEVRPGVGGTLYDRFGDLFAIICLAGTALLAIYAMIRRDRTVTF